MSGEIPAAGVGPTYVEMIQKMGNLQDITNKVNVIAEQNSQASTEILKRIGIIRERITNLSELWTKKTSEIDGLQEENASNIENLKASHEEALASHEAALADATKQGSASSIELAALKNAIVAADKQYTDQSEKLMNSINSTLMDKNILDQMDQLYNDVNALIEVVGATPMTPPTIDKEEPESSVFLASHAVTRGPHVLKYLEATNQLNKKAALINLMKNTVQGKQKSALNAWEIENDIPAKLTQYKGGSRKKRRRSSKKRHHITRRKHHSKKKHGGRKSLKKHKKDHKKKRPIKRVTFKKHH